MRLVFQAAVILTLFGLVISAGFWLTRRIGRLSVDTSAVLASIEQERRRMAMDLHDQVLSDISHIRRDCRNFFGKEKTWQASENQSVRLQDELEQVTNSIRNIIDDLHPHSITLLGLVETIRSFCNKPQASGLTINLTVTNWEENRLNQDQRLNLFRIFQELMHNIDKHARADQCDISLSMKVNRLTFIVQDNGAGLANRGGAAGGGRGMKNIQARGRVINARISWSAGQKGVGTRFVLTMSLAAVESI